MALHHLIERHLDDGGELRQTAAIGVVRRICIALSLISVVGGHIILHIPAFEHLAALGLKISFRICDIIVSDALLYVEHILFRGTLRRKRTRKGEA